MMVWLWFVPMKGLYWKNNDRNHFLLKFKIFEYLKIQSEKENSKPGNRMNRPWNMCSIADAFASACRTSPPFSCGSRNEYVYISSLLFKTMDRCHSLLRGACAIQFDWNNGPHTDKRHCSENIIFAQSFRQCQ